MKTDGYEQVCSCICNFEGAHGRVILNPLGPHDALKHHFTSLKTDLIFIQGFRMKIPMKLVYQHIFCNCSPTSSHLHALQVENCDSNSRLVVDQDDNGKVRLERVKTVAPMMGYYKQQEKTNSVIDENGWIRTGICISSFSSHVHLEKSQCSRTYKPCIPELSGITFHSFNHLTQRYPTNFLCQMMKCILMGTKPPLKSYSDAHFTILHDILFISKLAVNYISHFIKLSFLLNPLDGKYIYPKGIP